MSGHGSDDRDRSTPPDAAGLHAGREVDEEIAFHIAMREEQNRSRGLSEDEARREALERFGDVAQVRVACLQERQRQEQSGGWRALLWGMKGDVSLAFRQIRRSPGYAAVAILTLGLGIGANAVIYGFATPYFLRPLPYADAGRLVHLYQTDPRNGWDRGRFSRPQVRELRDASRGFTDIAAYHYGTLNLTGDEGPERITAGSLTANAFDVLGARPMLGRTFAAGEDGAAGAPVVVLGWGLWQRRYAGDPSIVGRTVELEGRARTVIGVMPRDFNFPFGGVKLWIPLAGAQTGLDRGDKSHLAFGRLAPGWTSARALEDARGLHAAMRRDHPDADGLMGTVIALPMREALNFAWDILRIAAMAMAGAVGLLLLIACANIAGLSLARSESRRREVAVRAALGASRFRIIRQSMIEMLLLALIGGLIAAVGAHAALRALGNVIPEDLFRVGEFRLDIGALAFSAAVIVTAALVAGIAPALLASRTGGGAALREDGRSLGGVRASRLRRALVVGEVALGLVLTIAAGLMARSLSQASRVPLGFQAEGVMTAEVTLPVSDYANRDAVNRFFDATLERLRATPGVIAVGTHASIPLNNETFAYRVAVEGLGLADEELPRAESFRVSDGYFEAMRIAVVEGRAFSASDSRTGDMLAVVNQTFAREVLGGDALGRRIHLDDDVRTPATVIGVVGDVRHSDLATASPPQVYSWLAQRPYRRQFLVLRSTQPEGAAGLLRESIAAVDPNLPLTIRPMQDFVNEALLRWSIMATALAVFGAIGLGLGAIGLYGLIAYSVERRRREIGVRLALGASPREVARSVILDGVRLAGTGVAFGLFGALAAGRLLSAALYGVPATDPLTLGGASAVYLVVAFAASALPAWRATRADPLTALRAD